MLRGGLHSGLVAGRVFVTESVYEVIPDCPLITMCGQKMRLGLLRRLELSGRYANKIFARRQVDIAAWGGLMKELISRFQVPSELAEWYKVRDVTEQLTEWQAGSSL